MMNAFHLAERCFALARSTTFAGERAPAIGRGTAIANKAGISLDLFDIPGRSRSTISGPRFARGQAAPEQYDVATVRDLMRRHHEHMAAWNSLAEAMRRAEAAAGARSDETAYDARRRNFDQAAEDAKRRDVARQRDRP